MINKIFLTAGMAIGGSLYIQAQTKPNIIVILARNNFV